MSHENKRITAQYIADQLGISKWTVLRAFKDDASIAEGTKKRVLELTKELGYSPNLLAQNLVKKHSQFVAVLIDDFTNTFDLNLLSEFTSALRVQNFFPIVINTGRIINTEKLLATIKGLQVGGVIILGPVNITDEDYDAIYKSNSIPFICVARSSWLKNASSVVFSEQDAIDQIMDVIQRKKYDQVIYLAGPTSMVEGLDRQKLLEKAVNKFPHISFTLARTEDYQGEPLRQAIKEAVDKTKGKRIIVADNDYLAINAMDEARFHLGLKVPEDAGFIGFDNIYWAQLDSYDLTTIDQPIQALVSRTIEMLKEHQELDDVVPEEVVLPGKGNLIVRNSV